MFQLDMKVKAVSTITEEGLFGTPGEHAHAEADETGVVLGIEEDGGINVAWEASGTVTICDPSEIEPV